MLSFGQALQNAAKTTTWAIGMCDNFVANMYGYSASGYATAAEHWSNLPGGDQHPSDYNAPAGALMFWGGGSNGNGHVAISDGAGGIYSTDISGPGTVSHVAATEISSKWGLPYLGWSPPVFLGQQGSVGAYQGTNLVAQQADTTSAVSSSLLSDLLSVLGINTADLLERAGLILLGGALIVMGAISLGKNGGVVNVVKQSNKAKRDGLKTVSEDVKEVE